MVSILEHYYYLPLLNVPHLVFLLLLNLSILKDASGDMDGDEVAMLG